MNILITGGAGFIGHELVRQLYGSVDRIVIYSRSESRQAQMKQVWPEEPDNKMRYFIGDIRDKVRLKRAMRGITHVIHAAALKRVEVCAYDVRENILTNIIGTLNVAESCIDASVSKAIFISTDKCVEPITAYGKAKAIAEDAFINYNNCGKCRFSVARYANVEGSTGSLLKIWEEQKANGDPLTVTHPEMTRMWITKEDAAKLVIKALDISQGGEIFIPIQSTSRRINDMAKKISDNIVYTGIRPAEKIHEILVSESDARDCYYDLNNQVFVIYPAYHPWIDYEKKGHKMNEEFRLTSNQ